MTTTWTARATAWAVAALLAAAPAVHAQRVEPVFRPGTLTIARRFDQVQQYNEHIRWANFHGRAAAGHRTRSFLWALVTAGVAYGGYTAWSQSPEADADGNGGDTRTYIGAGTLGVAAFTLLSAWDNLSDAGRASERELREAAAARRLFPDRRIP